MNGVKILMHKNDKVCECKFDSRGYLENVSKIYTEDLLPVGVGGEMLLTIGTAGQIVYI